VHFPGKKQPILAAGFLRSICLVPTYAKWQQRHCLQYMQTQQACSLSQSTREKVLNAYSAWVGQRHHTWDFVVVDLVEALHHDGNDGVQLYMLRSCERVQDFLSFWQNGWLKLASHGDGPIKRAIKGLEQGNVMQNHAYCISLMAV
jgi:hypothetical protein